MNKLNHSFITTSHDLSGLFKDVKLMSTLMRNIEKQSTIDIINYPPNDYMGDAFEFFVELFLHINKPDNRIGVYDYTPITPNQDIGADGIGININKEPCVVQIKYRSNVAALLTANEDHLSNLISAGALQGVTYDLKNKNNYRHFVFTTAESLHFYTDQEMFGGYVKCFGIKEFRLMLDNNNIFWDECRNITRNIDYKLKPKLIV
jgi:hypothetical protein